MKTLAVFFNLLLLTFLVNGSAVGPRDHGDKVVVCYFEGTSVFRPRVDGVFTPEDVDVTICTHVVYSDAVVEGTQELEVVPRNSTLEMGGEDSSTGFYARTLALKRINPGLKVYIDVFDRKGTLREYMTPLNNSAIASFARNAADFVHRIGFDGMHFTSRNIESFSEVADIVHEEFARRGLSLITFTVPADGESEVKYEMTEDLSRNFDLIIVGAYLELPMEQTTILSSTEKLERVVNGYKARGVPTEKLVVAIPAYSLISQLCNRTETGIGSRVCEDHGEEGAKDSEPDVIFHYSELKKRLADEPEEWVVVRDEASKVSYAHSNSLQWLSFEDPESVREKARFILENKLAGAAITNVDMEDFKGSEDSEKFPLTRAAFNALNGHP